jgi:hypothetical protein
MRPGVRDRHPIVNLTCDPFCQFCVATASPFNSSVNVASHSNILKRGSFLYFVRNAWGFVDAAAYLARRDQFLLRECRVRAASCSMVPLVPACGSLRGLRHGWRSGAQSGNGRGSLSAMSDFLSGGERLLVAAIVAC